MNEQEHHEAAHGMTSNDSINPEPWLERWWSLVVIGYGFLLAMFCLLIANQTFGR